MRGLRGIVAAWAGAFALLPATPLAATAATPSPAASEQEVKAAFLYHFAHLVDWPESAGGPTDPFLIAVIGPDPLGAPLDALEVKAVRSRLIDVQRFPTAAAMGALRPQILFVGGDAEEVERTLAAVAGQPVLTVGQVARFADRGGMIGFRVTPDGRVGFDINLNRAERAGLRMRSQLLKLARIVGERR